MARLLKFSDLKEFADNSSVPVIDGLSDLNHPCQILGDLQTIFEKKGKLKGLTLAYVGDCNNNVTYSLMHGCALVGMNINLGFPNNDEFKPKEEIVNQTKKIAENTGTKLKLSNNAREAIKESDVVVTDSWMSYHISPEKKTERIKWLTPFRITKDLMCFAKKDAIFIHCLPANREHEVEKEVMDGYQSVVFDQAENRLHIQKAIILFLLNGGAI